MGDSEGWVAGVAGDRRRRNNWQKTKHSGQKSGEEVGEGGLGEIKRGRDTSSPKSK